MFLSVLLYSFIFFASVLVIHYIFFSILLLKSKERKFYEEEIPISLILYTKNAEKELKENIDAFLNQEYKNYELLILNNASVDNTSDYTEQLAAEHANIKLVNVENNEAFWGSKKYALTLGIKAAKYDNLVFSDATAKPKSELWLSNIAAEFSETKQIIISHVTKGSDKYILNAIIRFANITSALKSLSFANFGKAFKANSFNFAYTRDAFFKVNGFINHMKINLGESELFLKDASKADNTVVCLTTNSFVESSQNYTFSSWIAEIKDEVKLKKHYKFGFQFFLSFFNFSKFFFFVLGVTCFFLFSWKLITPIFFAYFIIEFVVIGLATKRLKEPFLVILLPFLEVTNVLIQFSIFIVNTLAKLKY